LITDSDGSNGRGTSLVQYVKFRPLVIAAAFLLLLLCLTGLSMAFSKSVNTHFDFRTQYAAGYMVRTGDAGKLYDYDETRKIQNALVSESDKALPFIHLAYEAAMYVPFSFFTYQTAYFLFFAVNFGLLALAFSMLRPHLSNLEGLWSYLPQAIFVCFLPVTMTLVEGQNSILLLVIMILTLRTLNRGRDSLAGFLLGLASMKFQYVFPIAVLFLIWRRWRFLAGLAVSGASVFGFSVWLTGAPDFFSYLHLLGTMSARFSLQNGMHLGIRPELMPNLRGLFYAIAGGATPTALVLTVCGSIGVLVWAAARQPSFPLALMAASLVSYHETFTDATFLLLPVGLAAATAVKNGFRRSVQLAFLCATIIISPSLLLLAGVRFYLLALPILLLFVLYDQKPLGQEERPFSDKQNSSRRIKSYSW
jgi:Glycosyltransferase family 87